MRHWYCSVGVPWAATLKVAEAPACTDWSVGCVSMAAGISTVRWTASLAVEPAALVATQV